jgi:hypothetical protein
VLAYWRRLLASASEQVQPGAPHAAAAAAGRRRTTSPRWESNGLLSELVDYFFGAERVLPSDTASVPDGKQRARGINIQVIANCIFRCIDNSFTINNVTGNVGIAIAFSRLKQ